MHGPAGAALTLYRGTVDPAWMDRNDHVGVVGFATALAKAQGAFLRVLRLGFDAAHPEGSAVYALKWHMSFMREVRAGARLVYTAQLLDFSDKAFHYVVAMLNEDEGHLAATSETMDIHIRLATRRSAPLPPDRLAALETLWATHKTLPWPEGAGEGIAVRGGHRQPR